MTIATRTLAGAAAIAAALGVAGPVTAQDQEPLSVAYGDIASIESLNLLIAMERTKERGVPMEITYFNSEDTAVQAVLGGEAEIGVGAPYAFIQNSGAPVRMFFKLSNLLFFPVVNTDVYSGWEDLDGEEVTVHSRGSGTEALMLMMENVHDIDYSQISYVPGSEVRAGAMLQGTVDASIVDAANFRMLQEEGGDKFARLPVEDVSATDEALYATTDTLETRADDLQVFVEELLRTWRDIEEDPSIVGELREKYDLLPDLPEQAATEAVPYYRQAVENDVYPTDGGQPSAVADDISFLSAAGQVSGDPQEIDPSNFWNFDLLEAAKSSG